MPLMLASSSRVSEITALTWDDLSPARPGAHVLRHGKGREERLTPLRRSPSPDCDNGSARTPPNPVASCSPRPRHPQEDKHRRRHRAGRIKIHAAAAAATCPSIAAKNVTRMSCGTARHHATVPPRQLPETANRNYSVTSNNTLTLAE